MKNKTTKDRMLIFEVNAKIVASKEVIPVLYRPFCSKDIVVYRNVKKKSLFNEDLGGYLRCSLCKELIGSSFSAMHVSGEFVQFFCCEEHLSTILECIDYAVRRLK